MNKTYKKILRSLHKDWSRHNLKKLIAKYNRPTIDEVLKWASANSNIFTKQVQINKNGDFFDHYTKLPPDSIQAMVERARQRKESGNISETFHWKPCDINPFSSDSESYLKSNWKRMTDSFINESGKYIWVILGILIGNLPTIIHWLMTQLN